MVSAYVVGAKISSAKLSRLPTLHDLFRLGCEAVSTSQDERRTLSGEVRLEDCPTGGAHRRLFLPTIPA